MPAGRQHPAPADWPQGKALIFFSSVITNIGVLAYLHILEISPGREALGGSVEGDMTCLPQEQQ
jgi:hypothetical protein